MVFNLQLKSQNVILSVNRKQSNTAFAKNLLTLFIGFFTFTYNSKQTKYVQNDTLKNGFAIITALVLGSIITALAISLTTLLISELKTNKMQIEKNYVFFLAQAGIEKAKWQIINNPSWEGTDEPYEGSEEYRKLWLIRDQRENGSTGLIENLEDGFYKIVKEKEINSIYSVGFLGSDPLSSTSLTIIKIDFETSPEFKVTNWQEI